MHQNLQAIRTRMKAEDISASDLADELRIPVHKIEQAVRSGEDAEVVEQIMDYLDMEPDEDQDELAPVREAVGVKDPELAPNGAVCLDWRTSNGYSQAKLAKILGIQQKDISDAENCCPEPRCSQYRARIGRIIRGEEALPVNLVRNVPSEGEFIPNGQAIRRWRIAADMSQQQLGEAFGYTGGLIRQVESTLDKPYAQRVRARIGRIMRGEETLPTVMRQEPPTAKDAKAQQSTIIKAAPEHIQSEQIPSYCIISARVPMSMLPKIAGIFHRFQVEYVGEVGE